MAVLLPWRGEKRVSVSADFDHALTQEILRTELIRIKALIGTAALLGVALCIVYIFNPGALNRVWMGQLKPAYLYSILVPFILFELWVHAMIKRHLGIVGAAAGTFVLVGAAGYYVGRRSPRQ